MITNRQKHHLYHTYVVPIRRDPKWLDVVKGNISVEAFRLAALRYVENIQAQHAESTSLEDRCYIYLALWTHLGNTVESFVNHGGWPITMLDHLRQLAKDYPPETSDDHLGAASYIAPTPTQTPEETPMTTPAFETKHYIYGTDATKLTAGELIAAIGKVENEIAQLKSIKSKSTHIAAQVAALDGMRNSIVTLLDATGGAQ